VFLNISYAGKTRLEQALNPLLLPQSLRKAYYFPMIVNQFDKIQKATIEYN